MQPGTPGCLRAVTLLDTLLKFISLFLLDRVARQPGFLVFAFEYRWLKPSVLNYTYRILIFIESVDAKATDPSSPVAASHDTGGDVRLTFRFQVGY